MAADELIQGTLFDIQGFSVHDGPGCRTLIFLKGCSLKCQWCSNPEGISPNPEPLYKVEKCNADKLCMNECPHGAITDVGNCLEFDRMTCRTCTTFECVDACCTGALKQGGYNITVDQLYNIISRDRQYWGERGGITITGGEPFAQPDFSHELLRRCYEAYIHTAAETCGNVPWKNISLSTPWLDWIFFDLKHMDAEIHKRITGSDNHLILANAMKLGNEFSGKLMFRMPLIPGINDHSNHIREMSEFILAAGREEINILPVHHLGREKYKLIQRSYYTDDFRSPSAMELRNVQEMFNSYGVTCHIGSQTPF